MSLDDCNYVSAEKADDYYEKKKDKGKTRYDLVELEYIKGIADVLEFGLSKYSKNSWKTVDNAVDRYYAAAIRHLTAWRSGEAIDPESGLRHIDHALTNLYFISYFTRWEEIK